MPQKRNKENRGLPSRWRHLHGAYYYAVPVGLESEWDGKKLFRLGANLADAYRLWAERVEHPTKVRTIGDLLQRYALQVVPTKAPATQRGDTNAIRMLAQVFGAMPLGAVEPQHIYQYMDRRGAAGSARREIRVLSHAYTKAVEWGYLKRHPFKNEVRLEGGGARTRYVEDHEIVAALSLVSRRKRGSVRMIQAYIRLKLLTGLRRSDLLQLRASDMQADGIHVRPHKTAKTSGKAVIYPWTPALRSEIDRCLAARPIDVSPWLFCTRLGAGYINETTGHAEGWGSMWQRFMVRFAKETGIERFHESDLRAKVASDAESLERARALLAHADARTTRRVYRRKPEIVPPTR